MTGVPLALLAALTVTLVRLSTRSGGPAVYVAALLAVTLSVTLVGAQSVLSLEQAAGPSARPKTGRLRPRSSPQGVARAAQRRRKHSRDPYLEYVPSRAMLAMGGYTRMQSYDAARIRRARDLPPFGAPPLWDALWVLEHPAGGRTAQLLEKRRALRSVPQALSLDRLASFALQRGLYTTVHRTIASSSAPCQTSTRWGHYNPLRGFWGGPVVEYEKESRKSIGCVPSCSRSTPRAGCST